MAHQFSKNDLLEILVAMPGVAALFTALFQIFRDHAAAEREQVLEDKRNDFTLSATSHMADVAFDKHVEFAEKYLREVEKGLSELFRTGPSKQALELACQLYSVRTDFSAWVTEEIRNKLEPFEQALRKIGVQSDSLEHIPAGNERTRLVEDLYERYSRVAGIKEEGEKDAAAKEAATQLKESFQELLGIHEFTSLRRHFVDEAIRRCGQKSSFLQVLCLLLVAGISLSSRADTNDVARPDRAQPQRSADLGG